FRNHEGEALSSSVSQGTAGAFTLPKTPQAPNEPGGPLKGEKTAEGEVVLKWSAPTGGAPVVFYRVYRGTQNYTGRYAEVPPTRTEFVDTEAAVVHKYWVTAVSASMTESPFLPSGGGLEL